jgi:hypothetical protein
MSDSVRVFELGDVVIDSPGSDYDFELVSHLAVEERRLVISGSGCGSGLSLQVDFENPSRFEALSVVLPDEGIPHLIDFLSRYLKSRSSAGKP